MAEACRILHISRAGYYQWHSGKAGARTVENRRLAGLVKKIHAESPDKGYRRIRDDLARYYAAPVNDKRGPAHLPQPGYSLHHQICPAWLHQAGLRPAISV